MSVSVLFPWLFSLAVSAAVSQAVSGAVSVSAAVAVSVPVPVRVSIFKRSKKNDEYLFLILLISMAPARRRGNLRSLSHEKVWAKSAENIDAFPFTRDL